MKRQTHPDLAAGTLLAGSNVSFRQENCRPSHGVFYAPSSIVQVKCTTSASTRYP